MKKNILIRIDFQNDFVHPHGALSVNNSELIEKHQQFADSIFPNCFDEIIETYDTHFSETYPQTIEANSYPPHCIFGTWGWQQAAPFKPELDVTKIYKSTTNLWNERYQYQVLAEDWHGKNVFLCGLYSDVCVEQALNGLLKKGANVTILSDLCQGAQRQIGDIMEQSYYKPYIDNGLLRTITSAQFFRSQLHNKKVQHNLVTKSLGENHEQTY